MKGPALLVLLPLILGTAACSRDRGLQAAEGQKARAVTIQAAQVLDVRRHVELVGTLAAKEEVVVSAEVAGRVARLVHDLGDRVAEPGLPIRSRAGADPLQHREGGARPGAGIGATAPRRYRGAVLVAASGA